MEYVELLVGREEDTQNYSVILGGELLFEEKYTETPWVSCWADLREGSILVMSDKIARKMREEGIRNCVILNGQKYDSRNGRVQIEEFHNREVPFVRQGIEHMGDIQVTI